LLTADLVRARRQKGELKLLAFDAALRRRAEELAASLLAIAAAHVGRTRAELDEALAAVVASAGDRRLAAGLCKLVEDRCDLAADPAVEPEPLRRAVFVEAAAAWRGLPPGARFDRGAVLAAVAGAQGIEVAALEAGLYADLRDAHVVGAFDPISAPHLVEGYDLAQAQAVLLRAVKVTVEVEEAAPGTYRALFRALKFRRLLHTITERDDGGYRIEIDGPFSLFESSTKYGLALALALPAIRECDVWRLQADLRWGSQRTPLLFRLEGKAARGPRPAAASLPDEVALLLRQLDAIASPWRARPATEIIDLPGAGLCVPDLVFEHGETGECIYLEVLGYWSRAAVWRRVELVEQGLPERILFAVGNQLRVSEEVLGEDLPGALYVYKRTMSGRAILERIDALSRAGC
jgi:uncharacterized protein